MTTGEKTGAAGVVDTLETIVVSQERLEALLGPEGLQKHLEVLTQALGAARELHQQEKDIMAIVADNTATTTEVGKAVCGDLERLRQAVVDLTTPLAPQPTAWPWRWMAAAGLLGVLLTGAVWWGWPAHSYIALAVDLDRVMVQQYGQVAKPVQEQLRAVYERHGIVEPGQRQKGK